MNWKRLKTDPVFRANMALRSQAITAIRAFFVEQGFFEAETPTMVAHPGLEPHLTPFESTLQTHSNTQILNYLNTYLITSPEYALKKLLAGGLEKVFEIARVYRNGEPLDGTHNPEFSMLEWYRAGEDYVKIMDDLEQLCSTVAQKTLGTTKISYQGNEYDLAPGWERLSVKDAFARYCNIDLDRAIYDPEWFRAEVESKGCPTQLTDTFDDIFFRIFLRDIEPHLGQDKPTILYDYPPSMAALAKLKCSGTQHFPRKYWAERFEAYVAGIELCNAYTELNDPVEQRYRLEAEQEERRKMGNPAFPIDEDFMDAVSQMPDAGGVAFGVDRLVMLLTDSTSIKDVLFFPASDLFRSDAGNPS